MKAWWLKWVKISQNDYAIASLVYLLGLTFTVAHVIMYPSIISDHSTSEYQIYQQMLQHGGWVLIAQSTVASCLMSTFVPSVLYRIFGFDDVLLFSLFPCIFYSMLPAFTYLIARGHLNRRYALCAACLILFSSVFIYPEGRTGIAVGFLAGMVWAMLSHHPKLAIAFAVFLPFSHYGTTYITLAALALSCVYFVLRFRFHYEFRVLGSLLVVLFVVVFVWYGMIVKYTAYAGENFVAQAVDSAATAVVSPPSNPSSPDITPPTESPKDFYSLDSREKLIQEAFGKSFRTWPPQKQLGFVASWLIVISLTLGLAHLLYARQFTPLYRVLAVAMFMMIVICVTVPAVSIGYGTGRTYLASVTVLAPAFVHGIKTGAEKLKVNEAAGALICLSLLLLQSWLAHGTFYWILNIWHN